MQVPKSIQNLIEAFERLPGIGPKTAQRLTYYLLHAPKEEAQSLADAAVGMKEKTKICSVCFNIGEEDLCQICSDPNRDTSIIAIVEDPLDVLALEKSNYKGLYHVLHGVISPLENIGPDEIHIRELLPRLKDGKTKEIILATNPTMEGEATAMYIQRLISPLGVKITRIARGLPVGSDLEYADETTLSRALEGRKEY
ncbi:recombination protein RecR [Candidatus Daviesbacteria bacterium]|nr:recombination protein RecR [Candidatus Daviesbacteria bacterium]